MTPDDGHPRDAAPADARPTLDYARPTGGRPWWGAADAVLCGLVLCLLGLALFAPAAVSGLELVSGRTSWFPWKSGLFALVLPAAGLGGLCCKSGVQAIISGLRSDAPTHRRSTASTESDAKQV